MAGCLTRRTPAGMHICSVTAPRSQFSAGCCGDADAAVRKHAAIFQEQQDWRVQQVGVVNVALKVHRGVCFECGITSAPRSALISSACMMQGRQDCTTQREDGSPCCCSGEHELAACTTASGWLLAPYTRFITRHLSNSNTAPSLCAVLNRSAGTMPKSTGLCATALAVDLPMAATSGYAAAARCDQGKAA
jgi:hypothetical protein